MKIGTRIFFTLFMLVILSVCAAIIASALGWVDISRTTALINGFLYTDYKYIWAGAAAVVFAAAVVLIFFRSADHAKGKAVILKISDGSISITEEALKELVSRYFIDVKNIVVKSIKLSSPEEGSVRMWLQLSAKSGTEIPAAADNIKAGLKEYILTFSGLKLTEINIRIVPLNDQYSGS